MGYIFFPCFYHITCSFGCLTYAQGETLRCAQGDIKGVAAAARQQCHAERNEASPCPERDPSLRSG